MTKNEKKTFLIINISTSLIGVIYFIFKSFYSIETQFGNRPHPFTGQLLHLHILTVFPLVIVFGYILGRHALVKLNSKNKNRKNSGIIILVSFFAMSLSGYVLQVLISKNSVAVNTHLIASAIWLVLSLWHARK